MSQRHGAVVMATTSQTSCPAHSKNKDDLKRTAELKHSATSQQCMDPEMTSAHGSI